MRKIITSLILFTLFITPMASFAIETESNEPPKWEDYVPKKYQNPRSGFTRGKSIAELSTGIILTELLITAPIGIPMICHSTTKLKHIGYADKKVKFEKGLIEAQNISDPIQKQLYYDKLLKECKFKKKKHK